jgi:hypothetical protein
MTNWRNFLIALAIYAFMAFAWGVVEIIDQHGTTWEFKK